LAWGAESALHAFLVSISTTGDKSEKNTFASDFGGSTIGSYRM
jgi:hypothetical protein